MFLGYDTKGTIHKRKKLDKLDFISIKCLSFKRHYMAGCLDGSTD